MRASSAKSVAAGSVAAAHIGAAQPRDQFDNIDLAVGAGPLQCHLQHCPLPVVEPGPLRRTAVCPREWRGTSAIGVLARQQLISNAAQAVDVLAVLGVLAVHSLLAGVSEIGARLPVSDGLADPWFHSLRRRIAAGPEAEIQQLHFPVGCNHHIARPKVGVHDAATMRVGQRGADAADDAKSPFALHRVTIKTGLSTSSSSPSRNSMTRK